MSGPIRVLIVDDHTIVREGLRTLFSEEPDIEVVGEAADGVSAAERYAALRPDVVLLDLVMPGADGLQALAAIRHLDASARVIVLTSFGDDERVRAAIQGGAVGYQLKDVLKADLLGAVRDAAAGRPTLHREAQRALMAGVSKPPDLGEMPNLTPRETDVLRHLANGRSNREIAKALSLTEGTVKGYVSAILLKLGVEDRTQAALLAVRRGWLGTNDT